MVPTPIGSKKKKDVENIKNNLMKKIISIVGARPQFIKHAPMQLELQKQFHAMTIHTGQHYDENMSAIFFNELNIPKPDFKFDIGGSKPQGEQTGIMMTEIEKVCMTEKPDAILVYGDTNSTLAGALVGVCALFVIFVCFFFRCRILRFRRDI